MGFDLGSLLDERGEEGYELHRRHMNPQLPRVLHTIGFDTAYVRAEGAYLYDRDGDDYLDFLSGLRRVRHRAATTRSSARPCTTCSTRELPDLAQIRHARRWPGCWPSG